MRLKGKHAIVTGATRGIGQAIAKKMLQEGAKVMLCARDEQQLAATAKELSRYGEVAYIRVDVSKEADIQAMIEYTVKQFGRIDILVNNAGIAIFESFVDIDPANWAKTMDINLQGTFLVGQAVAKVMIEQNSGGSIVNMSSTNGKMGESGLAHYNASKAGIILLTRTMAIELAPYNIRANTVCPGFIATDLAVSGGMDEAELLKAVQGIPLKRQGTSEEVANVFAFLASDEASFVTGAEFVVDGGQICQQQ